MSGEQWQAAWELFQSADSLPAEQIHAFLNDATSDPVVRDAVTTMLNRNKSVEARDRIGQKVGRYLLTERLGEGGMGEVYAARDSELGRQVAVKLLAPALAGTAGPLGRFVREAKAASALNHPNIVTIYEVIHLTSRLAIVMELVGGSSIRRLCESAQPVDRVLNIGQQIARALAAAHAQGIVHCDIKPENLMVRQDGLVKVLDFGLARELGSDSATSLLPAGTLRYMSPEQSRGEPSAPASDIFSMGIVLYELAAGTYPFKSGSIFETLTAINDTEPPAPSSWNSFVPPHLDHLIARMLAKDPDARPSASEIAKLLESRSSGENLVLAEPSRSRIGVERGGIGKRGTRDRRARRPRWVALTLAAAVLVLAFVDWRLIRSPGRPLIRFEIETGYNPDSSYFTAVAVSRDGSRLAYVATEPSGVNLLAMRRLDQTAPTVFAGTQNAHEPFFSPDGQWIGFFDGKSLKKISVNGGSPLTLCPAQDSERGAAWGADGFIIANLDNSHLARIPDTGGNPEMLRARPEEHGERTWRWPQILPGGRDILLTGSRGSGAGGAFDEAKIEVLSLDTGRLTVILRGGYFGRYLPSGHLIYLHQGTLFAVWLDLGHMRIRGSPLPILEDVAGDPATGFGFVDFSTAPDMPEILVYRSAKAPERPGILTWINPAGERRTALTGVAPTTPAISPDGKDVALSLAGNIIVHDFERGVDTSLTRNNLINNSPVWTPDGKHIVYDQDGGDESTIWWTRADGSSEPRKLFATVDGLRVRSISPDGRRVAFARQNALTGWDIWTLPLDPMDPDRPKAGQPELFVTAPDDQFAPVFSPNGRWIAYNNFTQNVPGEIYVRPFPGSASARSARVSTGGGYFPQWSRDGRELVFLGQDHSLRRVRYTTNGENFAAGKPESWSPAHVASLWGLYWTFDLAPDGKRVLAIPAPAQAHDEVPLYHVTVLLNFFDELKRKVP